MNEQQPHISLGAVVAVMLAGAVAAVAICVALPSYGQESYNFNLQPSGATEVCIIDPRGQATASCTKEMIAEETARRRKEQPATKGDIDAITDRLDCLINKVTHGYSWPCQ